MDVTGGSAQPDHANHMNLMTATAPESFNSQSEPLPRTGWTAAASDASAGSPVSNILDGNPQTIWHSAWEGVPAPLPHVVTIDMKAVRDISGLIRRVDHAEHDVDCRFGRQPGYRRRPDVFHLHRTRSQRRPDPLLLPARTEPAIGGQPLPAGPDHRHGQAAAGTRVVGIRSPRGSCQEPRISPRPTDRFAPAPRRGTRRSSR